MKLSLRHAIDADPATFWETFFDPAYNAAVFSPRLLDMELYETLLEEHEPDGSRTRTMRLRPKVKIPRLLRGLLGATFEYTEEGRFDASQGVWSWRIIPGRFADKTDVRGRDQVEPRDGGVTRRFEAEVRVDVPGLGGMVERFIEARVRDNHERAAVFMNRWLAEKRGQAGW